jgi:Ca2+-binding EF-hand superfamily protein
MDPPASAEDDRPATAATDLTAFSVNTQGSTHVSSLPNLDLINVEAGPIAEDGELKDADGVSLRSQRRDSNRSVRSHDSAGSHMSLLEEVAEFTDQVNHGLAIFHDFLLTKFDTIILAWRKVFDTSGDGFVSYKEFVLAMASFTDYPDDVEKLWQLLDDDNSRMITLDEFHKESGSLLKKFKTWCESNGGVADAFNKIDAQKKSFIAFADWSPALESRGFGQSERWSPDEITQNCNILHRSFDLDNRGFVTIEDVIFLEENYLSRRAVQNSADVQQAANLRDMRFRLRERSMIASAHACVSFRSMLKKLFGNLIRGWRNLDRDGSWSLTRTELFQACKRRGWSGDVRALWRGLDELEDGVVRMENLDPDTSEVIARFLRFCLLQGGTHEVFTRMDKSGKGKVKYEQFRSVLLKMRYKKSEAYLGHLFRCLDIMDLGYLNHASFAYFDTWKPPDWMTCEGDPVAVEEFKANLLKMYGNYVKAWTTGLDIDSSNKVSWAEFNRACDKMKFKPKSKRAACWRSLDDDRGGYLTLAELDEDANDILVQFRTWCETLFGSVRMAFKNMDRDKSGTLSYSEFRAVAVRFGYVGDVKLLFDAFDTDGSGALTLDKVSFLDQWDIEEINIPPFKEEKVVPLKKIYRAPQRADYRNEDERLAAEAITRDLVASKTLCTSIHDSWSKRKCNSSTYKIDRRKGADPKLASTTSSSGFFRASSSAFGTLTSTSSSSNWGPVSVSFQKPLSMPALDNFWNPVAKPEPLPDLTQDDMPDLESLREFRRKKESGLPPL